MEWGKQLNWGLLVFGGIGLFMSMAFGSHEFQYVCIGIMIASGVNLAMSW